MSQAYVSRGRYFEDFAVGESLITAGRTITETDVVNFAGLSGDYTQLHTNKIIAEKGKYGQRIAHGFLVMSIASGLLAQLGLINDTVLAFREISWKFRAPVFIGETIQVHITVSSLKDMLKLGGGAVTFDLEVINQDDQVVQSGQWLVLIAGKA